MLCCSNEACAISVSRESLSHRLQDLQQQIKKALELLRGRKAGKAQLSTLRSAAYEYTSGDVVLTMRWHCCLCSWGLLACSPVSLGT